MNRSLTIIGSTLLLACTGKSGENAATRESKPIAASAPAFDQTPVKPAKVLPPAQPQAPGAPASVGKAPADAETSTSGLAWKVLSPGVGSIHPKPYDQVEVQYTGWTADGKMFGTTVGKNSPATFHLHQVIPGWSEGLQLMVEGESRRLWMPSELAYNNRQGAPAGDLTFDIKLVKINAKPAPPETPPLKAPANAKRTKSGVAYRFLSRGPASGISPVLEDTAELSYTGWMSDGKLYDSTVVMGKNSTMPIKRLVPGWAEAITLMREGDTLQAWVPEKLAFAGRPGSPPGDLVFQIELVKVQQAPKPVPAPKSVAAPPKDAEKTASGLSFKILQAGTGTTHPKPTDKVTVHYTGWTSDGKMFDSSVARGTPATFTLKQLIEGWVEGIALMVEGEKRRLWIPKDLAYKGRPGKPPGMLVFDVELIKIGE